VAARLSDGEVPSGFQGSALPSVVKPVVNLDKDFVGIQIMRSAKGETVIQENAAVCDVYALNVHRKAFAEALAEREVERDVRLRTGSHISPINAATAQPKNMPREPVFARGIFLRNGEVSVRYISFARYFLAGLFPPGFREVSSGT
jgi:hypothetical protein